MNRYFLPGPTQAVVLLSLALLSCSNKNKFSGSNVASTPVGADSHSSELPAPAPAASPEASPAATITVAPPSKTPVCFAEPKIFDGDVLKPVEKYNWKGSLESGQMFDQVMSTPIVLPRIASGEKGTRIFFNAFAIANPVNGVACYETNGRLVAVDGKTGAQLWISKFATVPSYAPAGATLKINGQDKQVIFVYRDTGAGNQRYLMAVDADTGAEIWTNTTELISALGISLGVIDGNTVVLSGNVYDALTGKKVLSSTASFAFELRSDSPGQELVLPTSIVSSKGVELCKFPVPIWNVAMGYSAPNSPIVAGVNFGPQNYVKVYDNHCKEIMSALLPTTGGGPITLADFDHDGVIDVATAGAEKYVVFSLSGKVIREWNTEDKSSQQTGSTSFDFNGDGYAEAVYNDEHKLRIYEGRTGKVLFEIDNPSGTVQEYPVIADVDGDGHADIVVAANNYAWGKETGLRVFQSPDNSWLKTRSVWNEHGYFAPHVTDTGKIVEEQNVWAPWLKGIELVGFRNNVAMPPLVEKCN